MDHPILRKLYLLPALRRIHYRPQPRRSQHHLASNHSTVYSHQDPHHTRIAPSPRIVPTRNVSRSKRAHAGRPSHLPCTNGFVARISIMGSARRKQVRRVYRCVRRGVERESVGMGFVEIVERRRGGLCFLCLREVRWGSCGGGSGEDGHLCGNRNRGAGKRGTVERWSTFQRRHPVTGALEHYKSTCQGDYTRRAGTW